MSRLLAVLACALTVPILASGDPPAPVADGLPTGKWKIEFANGVVETCAFEKENASESEPLRSSGGKAVARDGAVVVTFEDDRVERWTLVGKRWVVEHWGASALFPCGKPVVGIAERDQ